jgi:hypothetical protein
VNDGPVEVTSDLITNILLNRIHGKEYSIKIIQKDNPVRNVIKFILYASERPTIEHKTIKTSAFFTDTSLLAMGLSFFCSFFEETSMSLSIKSLYRYTANVRKIDANITFNVGIIDGNPFPAKTAPIAAVQEYIKIISLRDFINFNDELTKLLVLT